MEKELKKLLCPLCGGDGRSGWRYCTRYGARICMTCCRKCKYFTEFSGLFRCDFHGIPDQMVKDIEALQADLSKVEGLIKSTTGEDKKKMEQEKRRITARIKTKERILQGYDNR